MKMKILEAGLTETKLGGKLACFNSGETGIKVDESQPSGSQFFLPGPTLVVHRTTLQHCTEKVLNCLSWMLRKVDSAPQQRDRTADFRTMILLKCAIQCRSNAAIMKSNSTYARAFPITPTTLSALLALVAPDFDFVTPVPSSMFIRVLPPR